MKRYIIALVSFILACTLLSFEVSASTISTSFEPSNYLFDSFMWYDADSTEYEEGEVSFEMISSNRSGFSVTYSINPDADNYNCYFSIAGRWMDYSFFSQTGYDSYYLTFSYTCNVDLTNGAGRLYILDPSYNLQPYGDYDYAIYTDNSDGSTSVTYRISDPSFYPANDGGVIFSLLLWWEAYNLVDYSSHTLTYINDGIIVSKDYPDSGGGDSDETTAPDTGGDTGGGSGGDTGGGSGSGDANTTVIINKLDSVEQLLEDLKSSGVTQIELEATQNVLISQLPDKLKDMDLGTVTRPSIPTDRLSGLQQKEDELYGNANDYLSDKNSVIDGDFNNYVKPSFDNSSTAHGLFFSRVVDIPWIKKLVFISLWFGLCGFILRLGRKLI